MGVMRERTKQQCMQGQTFPESPRSKSASSSSLFNFFSLGMSVLSPISVSFPFLFGEASTGLLGPAEGAGKSVVELSRRREGEEEVAEGRGAGEAATSATL